MIIIGVDPGKTGAVGILYKGLDDIWSSEIKKLPESESDIWSLFRSLFLHSPSFAYLEKVHSAPGQGVASAFTFGMGYGFLRACLIGNNIPFDDVTPAKWQKVMGCKIPKDQKEKAEEGKRGRLVSSRNRAAQKRLNRERAQQLFPSLGKALTLDTSDAILIAEYGRRLRNGELSTNITRN